MLEDRRIVVRLPTVGFSIAFKQATSLTLPIIKFVLYYVIQRLKLLLIINRNFSIIQNLIFVTFEKKNSVSDELSAIYLSMIFSTDTQNFLP